MTVIAAIAAIAIGLTTLTPITAEAATKRPEAVTKLTAKSVNTTSIKLNWKKVKKATGYQVYIASTKNGKYKKAATIKKGSTVTYTKKKLKSNKRYWFKVRAYQVAKKKTYYGKFSAKKSAQTKKKTFTGKIKIVHINDTHTYLDDTANDPNDPTKGGNMGYAKIASFYDYVAKKNENTLFLNAGDCFFGTAAGTVDKGESVIPIVNTMGIDAMVTGNHEYTYGTEQLLKLTKNLNHPALCGNMVYKDKAGQPFASYDIQTLPNGMKVGIIGLTTPVSAAMGAADVKYVDAVAAAKKLVKEVKPKVDLTIALCHIGHTGDMNTTKLANEVKGLDLIIDGHSHLALPDGDRNNDNNVLIAQTGEYCKNVGLVDVYVKKNKMADADARLYSYSHISQMDIQPKEETADLISSFNVKSEEFFNKVVGKTSVDLNGLKKDIRTKETNMGNLYADVMREATGAEIGMFKAGPISTVNIPANTTITEKVLADMTRVDSLIISKKVKGSDILEFLNYSLKTWPKEDGSFQQVSGISFELKNDDVKLYNVKVNGQPLDEDREYEVATILGSDEEPGMINGKDMKTFSFSNSIMRDYIKSQPDQTIRAETDGRIRIVE